MNESHPIEPIPPKSKAGALKYLIEHFGAFYNGNPTEESEDFMKFCTWQDEAPGKIIHLAFGKSYEKYAEGHGFLSDW